MSTPTLRGIAKAYADGQIDRRTCILERRRLIDGIVSGELELVPYRPAAPESSLAPEEEDGDDTLDLALSDIERSPRRTRIWVITAIAIIGMIAAAFGVYLQRPAPIAVTPPTKETIEKPDSAFEPVEPDVPTMVSKPEPASSRRE